MYLYTSFFLGEERSISWGFDTMSKSRVEVNGRMVSTFRSRIGLGGIRERFTQGEVLWYMATMLVLGTGMGFVFTMLLISL